MHVLKLLEAEKVKASVDRVNRRKISKLYSDLSKDIAKGKIGSFTIKGIPSTVHEKQLKVFLEQIDGELKNIGSGIYEICNNGMIEVSEAVLDANRKELVKMGFTQSVADVAFAHVPQDVVKMIATGRVYEESWSLSHAIWGIEEKTHETIQTIIAKGAAVGKSSYDIAKDIEGYVSSTVAKPHKPTFYTRYFDKDGKEVRYKPGMDVSGLTTKKEMFYLGKVDYNALRLSRTLVSHAYQLSNIVANRYNPWVNEFQWRSAMEHGRTCAICMERDGKRYKKDEVPLDHPNGLCTIYAVRTKNLDDIADDIVKWVKAPAGTYPEIDRYAIDMFGAKSKIEREQAIKKAKEGVRNV